MSFGELSYTDYFTTFRLAKYDQSRQHRPNYYRELANRDNLLPQHVILRDPSHPFITRIHSVLPSRGELFYLRAILQHRPLRSFEDARTVENVIYDTFQQAADALGIFANEKEAEYALNEAVRALRTPRQLRLLFILLLVNDCVPTPLRLWDRFQLRFSQDYILRHNNVQQVGINNALEDLSDYLEEHGKKLTDYALPQPPDHGRELLRELERWGSNPDALATRARDAIRHFNPLQMEIYNVITSAVNDDRQILAFVDGKGGRGKTFILKAICDYVRSTGRIFLPGATSAFAAQNYEGGRTIHSVFKVLSHLIQIFHFFPFTQRVMPLCYRFQ